MTQDLQQRISETNEQLVLLLSEDPSVDFKRLEALTAGLVTQDAKEGNGIDLAKAILRLNRSYTAAVVEKEAAPKGKRKAKTNKAPASASTPAKKKRGRPKGSKNRPKAPKTEAQETPATADPAPATE